MRVRQSLVEITIDDNFSCDIPRLHVSLQIAGTVRKQKSSLVRLWISIFPPHLFPTQTLQHEIFIFSWKLYHQHDSAKLHTEKETLTGRHCMMKYKITFNIGAFPQKKRESSKKRRNCRTIGKYFFCFSSQLHWEKVAGFYHGRLRFIKGVEDTFSTRDNFR